MPILSNNRRERFCQGIAKGLSAVESYRQAGYRGQGHVAFAGASEILTFPEITNRIAELQAKAALKHEITVESLTRDLLQIRDSALNVEQHSAAVAAVSLIAKMHGFLVDKAEVTVQHKPAPFPTKTIELSEDEWVEQFSKPQQAITAPARNGSGRNA